MFSFIKTLCLKYTSLVIGSAVVVTIAIPSGIYLSNQQKNEFEEEAEKMFENKGSVEVVFEKEKTSWWDDVWNDSSEWTNEKALEYVKNADLKYSKEFLDWVGWENIMLNESNPDDIAFMERHPAAIYVSQLSIINTSKLAALGNDIESQNDTFEHLAEESPSESISAILNKKYPKTPLIWGSPEQKRFFEDFNRRSELAAQTFQQPIARFTSEPPNADVSTQGLRYIDITYDLTTGDLPHNGNYALDTAQCSISEETKEKLNLLSERKHYFPFMEKVWLSSLPPYMKFLLQNKMDMSFGEAKYLTKVLKKNHYYCYGFFTYLHETLLSENYLDFDFQYLTELYNQIAL